MTISTDTIDELAILMMFDLSTTQVGIKIHSDATEPTKLAANRLFEKGLLTQADGGYLTNLGYEAAQHAQSAVRILHTAT